MREEEPIRPAGLRPLFSAEEIAVRVDELAREVNRDYSGRELLLVGLLKGSFMFLADLIRRIDVPVAVDFLGLSSYGEQTRSSLRIEVTKNLQTELEGREVLIVEDILDTGLTARFALDYLVARRPGSLKLCVLVDKPEGRKVEVRADYTGFGVKGGFVVGYGCDAAEKYRNLPGLYLLDPARGGV